MITLKLRIVLAALAFSALAPASVLLAADARLAELALTKNDVDVEASKSFVNGKAKPAPAGDALLQVLGLLPSEHDVNWQAGEARDWVKAKFDYLIVFKRPITFGSLYVRNGAKEVRCLKAGAKLPSDLSSEGVWTALDVPTRQSGATVVTLAKPQTTTALLISEDRNEGQSSLGVLRLYKARWQNITPAALAYASHEYYRKPADFSPPFLYAASLVTSGGGPWQSSGLNSGRNNATPISDINPEWFLLAWDKPHAISGLWLHGTVKNMTLEYFVGPEAVHPRAGTASEWKKVRNQSEQGSHGRWITFDQPLQTRGLRINITKTEGKSSQIAEIDGLHVFENLGERPLEPLAPSGQQNETPPFEVPYTVADDANLTLVVNDKNGNRMRNLISRAPATAGKNVAKWDLRDENGGLVPPGEYEWMALTCPTLQPKYEFSVYPNIHENAPENSAWLNGPNGSGGWLADHCNCSAVCAVGEKVFIGAYMAESGVALIECDLAGHKKWGHPGFAAWTGVGMLACDGKTLFNATNVPGKEMTWGVDVETKQIREVLAIAPSANRKRGLQGIAARDGKLLISVSAGENWLGGSASPDDVDFAASYPLYGPPRRAKAAFEVVPNPRNDVLRLLRLTETPPGGSCEGAMLYLQSMEDAGKKQHIVIAFNRPMPIGSIVLPKPEGKDVSLRLSVLKPTAAYPPKMNDAKEWTEFQTTPKAVWDVIAAPEEVSTRALRLTFTKGEVVASDDLLAGPDSDSSPGADGDGFELGKKGAKAGLTDFGGTERWQARLEGMKILRRRFRNLSGEAKVVVNSGKVAPDGTWDALRDKPLTPSNPGVYSQQWQKAQKVRGVAIKEIDGRFTKFDVFTGPADAKIDLDSDENWKQVGEYEQQRRNYYHPSPTQNHDARYLDGYVDFGAEYETRAIRLRVVEQWSDGGDQNLLGVRKDRGAQDLDPKRCRVYGVAAVQYLGHEPAIDKKIEQRIEVYDSANGKLQQEIDIDRPGRIAFDAKGQLYAVSDKTVVKVDQTGGKHQTLITDLESPGDLTIDKLGQVYVVDKGAERQNVRVYSPAGKYVRSIGKTGGGRREGAWDPEYMTHVVDIDIDQQDQLWVVEDEYWPKRVTLWSTDGEFKKEFLGNTPYGGAGVLDPYDKSRLFAGPMEFELDWKTGHSRLKNLIWLGAGKPGEIPIRVKDRTYLVSRTYLGSDCGVVYLYEKDHLKLAAAMGKASGFDPFKPAEMVAKLGGVSLDKVKFIWSDRNGNGAVDPDEVVFSPKPDNMPSIGNFDRDLGAQSGSTRYVVKEILDNGVPVYEEQVSPGVKGIVTRLDSGDFHRIGEEGRPESGLTADGKVKWTYPSFGAGGHALYKPATWTRDQVVSEIGIIGHETSSGDLGEFLVMHTNAGAWNIWTSDGLLVGPIFRDYRDPAGKPWSMAEHDRGSILKDITLGQEHFQAYFCKSLKDNKYYAVAGHNHISVVEVMGLDQVKRTRGKIIVKPADLNAAQSWQEHHELAKVYERAPVIDCYRLEDAPKLDGKLDDWPGVAANIDENARFFMGFDDTHLYVAYEVKNMGPLKNTGEQWDRLFKSGASVDLQIGADPEAAVERTGCAPGDARLLMTFMGKKPAAVLYRPVVEGKPRSAPWKVVSPVAEVTFDEVIEAPSVNIARGGDQDGYIVEAAIPLETLSLKPADGMRLKLDWGFLRTGPDGHEVLQRIYWANKATGIVADAPSEARLHPDLWGFVRFHDSKRPSSEDRFDSDDLAGGGKKDKKVKADVDDILDSLQETKKK